MDRPVDVVVFDMIGLMKVTEPTTSTVPVLLFVLALVTAILFNVPADTVTGPARVPEKLTVSALVTVG
jgi:hypothetical protein